jgi:acyl-CoA synthetase (AMP-forming)/AMP-acid ligase II
MRERFDPADIQARCRNRMASFKVPRKFGTVAALPRNALGKIQKHLLPQSSITRAAA